MPSADLPSRLRVLLFAAANAGLLIVAIGGVWLLPSYPGLGFTWGDAGAGLTVGTVDRVSPAFRAGIRRNDVITGFEGTAPLTPATLELALLDYRTGDTVAVTVSRDGRVCGVNLPLDSRYHTGLIVVTVILGLSFWSIGIFVFASRSNEYAARVCAWAMVFLGSTIAMVWPGYSRSGGILRHAQPVLYLMAYAFIPVLMLVFFLVYPRRKSVLPRRAVPFLFIPALAFGVTLSHNYLRGVVERSLDAYAAYLHHYGFFRVYLAVHVVLSLVALLHSRITARTKENRHKVQWMLGGVLAGGSPFVALWTLPQALGKAPIVTEELSYLFMLLIPLAFAFSIVRYHALDIEVVVSRAMGYAVVSVLIIALYLGISGLAGVVVHSSITHGGRVVLVACTLLAAVMFAPLRYRVQDIVDRTFYRVRYTYRIAMRALGDALGTATTRSEVFTVLRRHAVQAIPVSMCTVVERDPASASVSLAGEGDMPEDGSEALLTFLRSSQPPASDARLPSELLAAGVCAVVPIHAQGTVVGHIGIGRRLSGGTVTDDDVDLLRAMGEEAFLVAERLRLQESVILERAEARRLEQVDRMRSEFLAHVSHELRTPLTSIRWSVENLLDGIPEPSGPRVREYLVGIRESSARLGYMIENLLHATRIDAGRVEVVLERQNLCDVIKSSLDVIRPVAEKKGIELRTACTEGLEVMADRHGLQAVLINLLDNAVKYSCGPSIVTVETRPATADEAISPEGPAVAIAIGDEGVGIPPERLDAIFERFERVRCEKTARESGLGLGLHIVKELVQRQNGRIIVASTPGVGSTFTVVVPAPAAG